MSNTVTNMVSSGDNSVRTTSVHKLPHAEENAMGSKETAHWHPERLRFVQGPDVATQKRPVMKYPTTLPTTETHEQRRTKERQLDEPTSPKPKIGVAEPSAGDVDRQSEPLWKTKAPRGPTQQAGSQKWFRSAWKPSNGPLSCQEAQVVQAVSASRHLAYLRGLRVLRVLRNLACLADWEDQEYQASRATCWVALRRTCLGA